MEFVDVRNAGYEVFHHLLNEYYRDGEDAETAQSEIDSFVEYLFGLCQAGEIFGCIAREVTPIGFVLWNVDSPEGAFCQKPGFGTILEIGVSKKTRGNGIGKMLTDYAESKMAVERYYVCAYGPAESFWEKCGYAFSGEKAENGLKIMVKGDGCGR